jgi:RNA polymerase sigma-70 factor (ECF subfamily)
MDPEQSFLTLDPMPAAEAALLQGLRQGDANAGHQFVRAYYPAVYRYLLYLTGHRESAEDLTQETFLQAWRRLDSFEGRAPLRLWLHRIAHREFLQSLRSQRSQTSLEEVADLPAPQGADWTEAAELRDAIRQLPREEGEVVVLHYLHGYSCQEIGQIVRIPVSTVKYRLLAARSHLQRALGEGDLTYLNEWPATMRRWAWLPLDQMSTLEARLRQVEGSKLKVEGLDKDKAASDPSTFNLQPSTRTETDVIDSRLTRKVTVAFKAQALSDVCERLRDDTGIHLAAGRSVADEKVTLFCRDMPLRDVMRQLSRPFGYTWVRSGKPGHHKYELMQDLRSQLLEEELRNRDRNTALLVLEKEIERYRPYLDLSPDEALARAKTAPADEKRLLEQFAGAGWGPIQMYFRLTPGELAALRSGQELHFLAEPRPGDRSVPPRLAGGTLPADIARGVLQSMRNYLLRRMPDGGLVWTTDKEDPTAFPLTSVPDPRAWVTLQLTQSELGQFTLGGECHFILPGCVMGNADDSLAVGARSAVLSPENRAVNAKFARDSALRPRVSIRPESSCVPAHAAGEHGTAPEPQVTTADVLEALHHVTGLPLVADSFTRLYPLGTVSVQHQPIFDALSQLSDTMRLRWNKDGGWLQLRSTTFYDDRLKEVPNRHLSHWVEARRTQGALTLEVLIEITQLPDAQLDAAEMAGGARECFGLLEWDLARNRNLRPHLRFLAGFTPAQRQEAMTTAGLPFEKMSLAQQQQYISLGLDDWEGPLQSLEDLAGAVLRVEYTQPGWFEWRVPGLPYYQWLVPVGTGAPIERAPRPQVRERTREAALRTARRLFPAAAEAELRAARRLDHRFQAEWMVPQEDQIVPSELDLTIIYVPGRSTRRQIHWVSASTDVTYGTY